MNDPSDNCALVPNPDQQDTDDDGVGDACESPPPPILSCQTASASVGPGETIRADLFITQVTDLRADQVTVDVDRLMGAGALSIECPGGAFVETARPDFVFVGATSFPAVNGPLHRVGAIGLVGGSTVGATPAYLGSFLLTASQDVAPCSVFELTILPEPQTLLRDPLGQALTFEIQAARDLAVGVGPPPVVTAIGPRYIEIAPSAAPGAYALGVTPLGTGCPGKWVDFDPNLGIGRLVASPVYRTAQAWGIVRVANVEAVPGTTLEVRAQWEPCAAESAAASATTWLWGDVNDPDSWTSTTCSVLSTASRACSRRARSLPTTWSVSRRTRSLISTTSWPRSTHSQDCRTRSGRA